MYPKGVTEHTEPHMSIFLKLADAECIPSTQLPHAKIELMIVNRAQHLDSVTKSATSHLNSRLCMSCSW